jgi:hypothetical protein
MMKKGCINWPEGKPGLFFPPQVANHGGRYFPYTFFGIAPGTTKEQIRECRLILQR